MPRVYTLAVVAHCRPGSAARHVALSEDMWHCCSGVGRDVRLSQKREIGADYVAAVGSRLLTCTQPVKWIGVVHKQQLAKRDICEASLRRTIGFRARLDAAHLWPAVLLGRLRLAVCPLRSRV